MSDNLNLHNHNIHTIHTLKVLIKNQEINRIDHRDWCERRDKKVTQV